MGKIGEEIPLLVAQTGPLNGQRWAIKKRTILGRESYCDIVIPERQVSRQHACIVPFQNQIFLEDLGSKNGTHCNGLSVTDKILLNDGDIIQIALVQSFIYLSSDATIPLDLHISETDQNDGKRLVLNKFSRRVWINNIEINPPLSLAQFRMLEILYNNQKQVTSRSELIEAIWSEKEALNISNQALDALIRRLRERLTEIDAEHEYIITVRGHGLRFDNPPNMV